MKFSLFPSARAPETAERATEATDEQLFATGAAGGYGVDPVDGDSGFRLAGSGSREIPGFTLEKTRAYSVLAYRINPMARAIIDTYTSFAVGDSGVTVQCLNPEVRAVVDRFWNDPRNMVGARQPDLFRDHLLMGETAAEMMVGSLSGVTRYSIIDPSRITTVGLHMGNPLWPATLGIRQPGGDDFEKTIASVDDVTGLRSGEVLFWASFKALLTDRRGSPFLAPILDDLDAYDLVRSNLLDRTAVARHIVWDVTVNGDQKAIDEFIAKRGGVHVPPSGTVEVHNEAVKWEPKSSLTGAFEDSQTAQLFLTNIAGGAGLAKTWLAEPEDANRATSLTMAEPVRRRVGGIQNMWLAYMTEMVRYVVDQAVAAHRLPAMVPAVDSKSGVTNMIPASQTVSIHGPEVAAADAQVTAEIMVNLSKGLIDLVAGKLLTPEAARVLAKKAWEQYAGVPYTADLDREDGGKTDDLATLIDDAQAPAAVSLKLA